MINSKRLYILLFLFLVTSYSCSNIKDEDKNSLELRVNNFYEYTRNGNAEKIYKEYNVIERDENDRRKVIEEMKELLNAYRLMEFKIKIIKMSNKKALISILKKYRNGELNDYDVWVIKGDKWMPRRRGVILQDAEKIYNEYK